MTGAIFKVAACTIVLVGTVSTACPAGASLAAATAVAGADGGGPDPTDATSEFCDVAVTSLVDGTPEFVGAMAVPQFDPGLGTLRTVSVSGVVVLDYEATGIENLAGSARQLSAAVDVQVGLTVDGAEDRAVGRRSIRQAYTVALGGYDGLTDLHGTSGLNGSNLTFMNTGDDMTSVVYTAEPLTTPDAGSGDVFVGDETVELGIAAELDVVVSPSVDVFVATNSMVAGELCVTYGYRPGPAAGGSTSTSTTISIVPSTEAAAVGSIDVISGPASIVTASGSTGPLAIPVPSPPGGIVLPETGSSTISARVAASASTFLAIGLVAVRVARRPRRRSRAR